METTSFIVLKKIVYREHDLIVHGISPDFGRLDLLASGELRSSDKQLPAIGLFRELEVAIEAPASTLVRIDHRELIGECDAIGNDPALFDFAVKSGAFLLKNCAYELPSPLVYDTLRNMLHHLANPRAPGAWSQLECSVIIKSVFLYENGLLPQLENPRANGVLEQLVEAGVENQKITDLTPDTWDNLKNFLNKVIKQNNLPCN